MTYSEVDHFVFLLGLCIYLVVNVDDIVIIGNYQDGVSN